MVLVLGFVLLALVISLFLRTNASALTPTVSPFRTPTSTGVPGAEFVGTPLSGAAPLTVQFTDISTSILSSCTWNFGDGSALTLDPVPGVTFAVCPPANHTYTTAGSFTVSLSVVKATTGRGNQVTRTNYIQVSVSATATPIMQYTFSGTITSAQTGAPIAGAVVHVYQCHSSQSAQATTAANGTYSLALPAAFFCDSSYLQVTAAGYLTQTGWSFVASSPASIVVNLALQPVGLSTATATVTPTPTATCSTLTVTGHITNSTTGQGIAGATVEADTSVSHPFAATTASDGSYLLSIPGVSNYACEVIGVRVFASGYQERDLAVNSAQLFALPVLDVALLSTTATPTVTPTRPVGPSSTPTPTRTVTPTPGAVCSPVTVTIAAPFTQDGAGTFCWQSSNLGSYINSWNLANLTVNGVNFTNAYVAAAKLPAKINGFWYVSYTGSFAWSHFETK
jgi:PKD repeat protein